MLVRIPAAMRKEKYSGFKILLMKKTVKILLLALDKAEGQVFTTRQLIAIILTILVASNLLVQIYVGLLLLLFALHTFMHYCEIAQEMEEKEVNDTIVHHEE